MNPFKTGDLAEFMGMTNTGIHYLEKRGLIQSQREENGYRTYSIETLTSLGIIRCYERIGFSLNESAALMDAEIADVRTSLEEKRRQLLSQLETLEYVRERLQPGPVAEDCLTEENCQVMTRPRMFYCPVWEEAYDMNTVPASDRRLMRDIDVSWLAAMPYMTYCSKITMKNGRAVLEKGNCIPFEHANDVLINHLTPEIPSVPCLTFDSYGNDCERIVRMAGDYAAALGYELEMPIYAPIVNFNNDFRGKHFLSKYYVPMAST